MSSNLGLILITREDISDEQLLKAYADDCIRGESSFEILFDRYFNRLHAYFIAKGATPDQAEDLAQEVFLRIVKAAHTFDQNRPCFRAWLFRIATNLFIDFLREKGDLKPVPLEECEASLGYVPPPLLRFDKFLRDMEPELREPLELSALCGLTAPEIAEVLHLPVNTVYSRIYRARRKLRRKLDPHAKIKRTPKKTIPTPPKPAPVMAPDMQTSLPYGEDRNE